MLFLRDFAEIRVLENDNANSAPFPEAPKTNAAVADKPVTIAVLGLSALAFEDFGPPAFLLFDHGREAVSFRSLNGDSGANTGIIGIINTHTADPATDPVDPVRAISADVNQDGLPDLLVLDGAGGRLWVYAGQSEDGTRFSDPQRIPVGASPRAFAVADVNADGITDVSFIYQNSQTVRIFLGEKSESEDNAHARWTLRPGSDFIADGRPTDIAVGDLTGGGRADLVLILENTLTGNTVIPSTTAAIYAGLGDGRFSDHAIASLDVGDGAVRLYLGAFDGAATGTRQGLTVLRTDGLTYYSDLSTFFNDALNPADVGVFASEPIALRSDFLGDDFRPEDASSGDFNGDGLTDLVILARDADRAGVFLGGSDGPRLGLTPLNDTAFAAGPTLPPQTPPTPDGGDSNNPGGGEAFQTDVVLVFPNVGGNTSIFPSLTAANTYIGIGSDPNVSRTSSGLVLDTLSGAGFREIATTYVSNEISQFSLGGAAARNGSFGALTALASALGFAWGLGPGANGYGGGLGLGIGLGTSSAVLGGSGPSAGFSVLPGGALGAMISGLVLQGRQTLVARLAPLSDGPDTDPGDLASVGLLTLIEGDVAESLPLAEAEASASASDTVIRTSLSVTSGSVGNSPGHRNVPTRAEAMRAAAVSRARYHAGIDRGLESLRDDLRNALADGNDDGNGDGAPADGLSASEDHEKSAMSGADPCERSLEILRRLQNAEQPAASLENCGTKDHDYRETCDGEDDGEGVAGPAQACAVSLTVLGPGLARMRPSSRTTWRRRPRRHGTVPSPFTRQSHKII